jgi:hypothetical protein
MAYRRDLSSTIKLLALGLAVFIGYQVWLKPTYLAPTQPAEPPSQATPLPAPPIMAVSEPDTNQLWDVPSSRLVDLGSAPNQQLQAIREELDRGHYNEVERRLRTFSQKKLTAVAARRYVAAIWNNLGVQQEKFGGTALSVKAFAQSVAWDPTGPLAHLNLTQAYWELRHPAMTQPFLETVIRLAPNDPFPHLALADLLVSNGKSTQAAQHIKLARPRAERDPNHRSYLQRLTAKVDTSDVVSPSTADSMRIAQVTSPSTVPSSDSRSMPLPSPSPESTRPAPSANTAPSQTAPQQQQPAQTLPAHFTVQFDGPPDQATWARMHAILNYAYEELSQKYGHVPAKSIPVVLHTNQKFSGASDSPAWADSLFDHSTGTIHLPTQGALEDLAFFSRIARHEFVHALLFEHMKGAVTGVPSWLTEGLAMQLAEDAWADIDDAEPKTRSLMPLTSLQGDWKQLSSEEVQTAYHEAKSATQYLVDRHSMYGLRQLLNQIQTGRSFDAALQQKFSMSHEQFQRQWEQTRQKPMVSSGP